MKKILLSAIFLAACSIPRESILRRQYKEGEILHYQFEGSHSMQGTVNHQWHALAISTVKKDKNGIFHEELQWTQVHSDGQDIKLAPDSRDFRQLLSLDPKFKGSFPNLAQLEPALYSPILDMMTFYVDEQWAIKHALRAPGDHVYIKHGKPNSWADGKRITAGYDCIDFDVRLIDINAAEQTATVRVRHVPPIQGCKAAPAAWMQQPAFDTANNWFEVEKKNDNEYEAGVGKEIFDVELKVLLPSGIIKSATEFNPVEIEGRTCRDDKLSDCGSPQKIEIVRKISISLD